MPKTLFLGQTLPLQRTDRGYFQSTTDRFENEKSKFINLILTKKGERVSNPAFGCDLWLLLFEQKDGQIQDLARDYVSEAVNTFMPYLTLQQVRITNDETFLNDNSINLYVRYGFVNNPLVTDQVQLTLGAANTVGGNLAVSGRTTTRNF
jgi:phage baseplate assembly protein W